MNIIWKRNTHGQAPLPLVWVGVSATLIYAFSKVNFSGPARISAVILALTGLWCLFRYNRKIYQTEGFYFLGVSLLVQAVSWLGSIYTHPDLATDTPKIDELSRIFLFLPLAWWLGGSTRNTLTLWCFASIGVLLSPWVTGGGFAELFLGIQGQRVDFSISNAQHTGLLFGTLLIGLITLSRRFIYPVYFKWTLRAVWVLASLFSLLVVIVVQTRSVWLGLCITGIVSLLQQLKNQRSRLSARHTLPAVAIAILVIVGAFSSFTNQIIEKRLSAEKEIVTAVLDGEVEKLPYSSIAIRVQLWKAGLDFFLEKPLLGWGDNGKRIAINKSGWMPANVKANFGHLHNSYLELLVNYGLLGLLFYISFMIWIASSAVHARRRGDLPGDLLRFLLLFLAFWSTVNFFESFLFFWTGAFVLNIVLGGIITHTWKKQLAIEP